MRKTQTLRLFLKICCEATAVVMAFGKHPLALQGPIWQPAMEESCRNQKLFPDLISSRAAKPIIIRNKQTNKRTKSKAAFLFVCSPWWWDWYLGKAHPGLNSCCWFPVSNCCLWLGKWQQDSLRGTQSKLLDEITAGIYSCRLLPSWCQVRFEPAICCKSLPWKSAFLASPELQYFSSSYLRLAVGLLQATSDFQHFTKHSCVHRFEFHSARSALLVLRNDCSF